MTEIPPAYPGDVWVCLACGWVEIASPEIPPCHQSSVLAASEDVELGANGRAVRVKFEGQQWRVIPCLRQSSIPRS